MKEQVLRYLKQIPDGKVFHIQAFHHIGSRSSVQRIISQLVSEGLIVRSVVRGFYFKPKELKIGDNTISYSPGADSLAKAWANHYGYILVGTAIEATNRVGFFTQMQVQSCFWSDGPTREFKTGNSITYITHVSSKLLWGGSTKEGLLYRAMTGVKACRIDDGQLRTAFKRLQIKDEEISSYCMALAASPLPKDWLKKIKQFRHINYLA
ncbi:DUF6088 family protein [Agarilytica rhodophyticola]|uniref:DUF6088 family protein n=1 Tax=Agarilytica rhodophyticola TaxID=1737490 RepID=UPI000CD9B2A8|nr:DUF6088 family protein [Agarilytica rhodophyticola]